MLKHTSKRLTMLNHN